MARPQTAGPESGPEPPFPVKLSGPIIKGFGRGSKEITPSHQKSPKVPNPKTAGGDVERGTRLTARNQLGIPTANIPIDGLSVGGHSDIASGVYFGLAGLSLAHSTNTPTPTTETTTTPTTTATPSSSPGAAAPDATVYPAVLSIGYNLYYGNTVRSVEAHLLHAFPRDFYGAALNLSILGFIRPEANYDSLDALVADIRTDIAVADRSLRRPAYAAHADDAFLLDFGWVGISPSHDA